MSKVGTPLNQVLDLNPFTDLLSPNEFDPIAPKRVTLGNLMDFDSETPLFEAIQRPPYLASLNQELLQNVRQALQNTSLPIITRCRSGQDHQVQFGRYIAIAISQNGHPNQKLNVLSFDVDWQPSDESHNKENLKNSIAKLIRLNVLSPLEEGRAIKFLSTYWSMNQADISKYCGCSRSQVSNIQRLLSLPQQVLQELESGTISSSHCRTLLTLKDDHNALAYYCALIKDQQLSVHGLSELIRSHHSNTILESTMRRLNELGITLRIEPKEIGGTIIMNYSNSESLHLLLERLRD